MDINVSGILILRQYKASSTLNQEEDVLNIITFKVDVVLLWEGQLLKQRTYPSNECSRPPFETIYPLVSLFMYIK